MTLNPENQKNEAKNQKKKDSSSEAEVVLDSDGKEVDVLSASEKKIRDAVVKVVMSEINPLLMNLQKASNQVIQNSAAAQAKNLEDGIKEKIERRMAKINSVMVSRGI